MSSWHAVDPWSTRESEPAYSQISRIACRSKSCRYIKSVSPVEITRCPKSAKGERIEGKYMGFAGESVHCKKAVITIQKIWRGFLVRNPTGIPTKEFIDSMRKII